MSWQLRDILKICIRPAEQASERLQFKHEDDAQQEMWEYVDYIIAWTPILFSLLVLLGLVVLTS